jgi:hypothetical protein
MANHRQPKKSETIEVRLDHETKSALQARAQGEGRSVSEIIRGLIARYLGEDAPNASATRSIIMRFSLAAAASAAFIFGAVTLTTPARAADLSLGIRAMMDHGGMPPQVPAADASVQLDYGQSALFCVPEDADTPTTLTPIETRDACAGVVVLIWVQPGAENHVLVGMRVLQHGDAAEPVGIQLPLEFGNQGEVLANGPGMSAAVRMTFLVERP